MKARKKHAGMKHKVRGGNKTETRIALAVTVPIFISGRIINSQLNPPSTSHPISSTYPNQTFTQTATNTLEQAGYTVDYYPSEKVAVEFYRNLPTHRYDLIILRVHSLASGRAGQEVAVSPSHRSVQAH